MDLFHLQSEAQGSVFWHPKGYPPVARARGLYAPPARRRRLSGGEDPAADGRAQWEQSGHWGKYRENMFVVPDEMPNTEEEGPVLTARAT
jgi:threonyl-tRNA synthetase